MKSVQRWRQKASHSRLEVSDVVSRHVSRLETSRDTYLHVSVLSQSRRIHVLSWLESRSSMSPLGSVSWLSWCVLAQCVLRWWHIRFEHYSFVNFVVTSWLWSQASVYLFTVDRWNNFKLILNCFVSSHVLTSVSWQCLKSRTLSLRLSLVSSRPNPKCLGSSHVSIPLSWPMSVSEKNVSTPSLLEVQPLRRLDHHKRTLSLTVTKRDQDIIITP